MALPVNLRALAAALLLGATSAGAQRSSGYFELRRTYDDARRVQLSLGDEDALSRGGRWSSSVDAAKLDGLVLQQLARDGDSMHFRLVRDAGVIDFVGRVSDDRVRGRYSFRPERRFADALVQRGVGRPDEAEQFQLALYDIGYAMLDELGAQRYAGVDVGSLVRMGMHGASLDYLRAMDAAGYRVGDVDRMIALRDHGVTASYARALADVGVTGVSLDNLQRARDHGVSADFVDGLQRAGFDRLALGDLIRLRDHGVTAGFARVARRDYGASTVSELVRLRDEGMRD